MPTVLTWLHDHQLLLWLLSMGSLLLFVATLVCIPLFVARMPPDYFCRAHNRARATRQGTGGWLALVLKNMLGGLLIVVGLAMLVLPGQGIITIVIGLALTDFPGKWQLQLRLVRRPGVLNTLNWMRKKTGQSPLRRP